mgnify:FL=1|jgi:hypothetical protein
MFLNERSQVLIKELRDNSNGGVNTHKASICDAMSIIMFFYQMHASDAEKEMLADAIDTLSNYNDLLTALSKEK